MSEQALLTRLQAGERAAVLEVYDAYFAPLYHYLYFKVGEASLADDITSDVFVRLLECIGTERAPHSQLKAWLFRVAHNELLAYFRQKPRIALESLEEERMSAPNTNPELSLLEGMENRRIHHALKMLKPEQQEVLLLRFSQNLNLEETAEAMGKSTSAIKSLQFRAIQTLRHILMEESV